MIGSFLNETHKNYVPWMTLILETYSKNSISNECISFILLFLSMNN